MKKIAFALVMSAFGASAFADTYWNGDIVTDIGLGDGGADVSRVDADPNSATFGLAIGQGASNPGPFHAADDFTVGSSNILMNSVTVYGWAKGNAAINAAYVKIWDGAPNTAGRTAVYGGFTATENRMISASAYQNNGHDVYRVANADGASDTSRKIVAVNIGLGSGVGLMAGHTYWIEWSLKAQSQTQVFGAPVAMYADDAHRGNGLQGKRNGANPAGDYVDASLNAAVGPAANSDWAYAADYTAVPEPGTVIAVGAGLAALVARRRRKA